MKNPSAPCDRTGFLPLVLSPLAGETTEAEAGCEDFSSLLDASQQVAPGLADMTLVFAASLSGVFSELTRISLRLRQNRERVSLRNALFSEITCSPSFEPGQMRLTQVSRQSFVGIDLLGQELGPAPFRLVLLVFCRWAEPRFVELILH
jgi:hypothetical protein